MCHFLHKLARKKSASGPVGCSCWNAGRDTDEEIEEEETVDNSNRYNPINRAPVVKEINDSNKDTATLAERYLWAKKNGASQAKLQALLEEGKKK